MSQVGWAPPTDTILDQQMVGDAHPTLKDSPLDAVNEVTLQARAAKDTF